MPESAPAQVQRLIDLIAWMSQRDTNTSIPYRAAAKHLGVSKETVRRDLDALVALSDEFKPWLASLSVAIVADGFVVESRGSFRRPFRLTPEESLALMIGLAAGRNGTAIAKKLGSAIAAAPSAENVETSYALGPTPSAHVEQGLSVARQARDVRFVVVGGEIYRTRGHGDFAADLHRLTRELGLDAVVAFTGHRADVP